MKRPGKRGSSSALHEANPGLWSVVAFQDEITRSLNLSDPPPSSIPAKPKKTIPRTLPPLNTAMPTGAFSSSYTNLLSATTTPHHHRSPNSHPHAPHSQYYTYPHSSHSHPSSHSPTSSHSSHSPTSSHSSHSPTSHPSYSPTSHHSHPPTSHPPPSHSPTSLPSHSPSPTHPPATRSSIRTSTHLHSPPQLLPVSTTRSPPSFPAPAAPAFAKSAPNGKTALKGIGKGGKEREKEKESEIVVLDARKQQLTLAQKMGLTPAPPAPLSHTQWEEVKKISDSRNDSHMPCAICRDEFRVDGQVLLSCSHVFHKICLDSYEKFSKTKSCPLCRKEEYQKAQILEGKRIYLNKCATKIQAAYRGYRARKLLAQILDANPPEEPTRRKVFYEKKLSKITDQLLRRIEEDRAMIDSSMHAMNHNVAASIAYLRTVPINSMLNPATINWKEVTAQAKARNPHDCPICLMPLSGPCGTKHHHTILSCSHVFHDACIESFEQFNCETVHLCPVCRTMYHKNVYSIFPSVP